MVHDIVSTEDMYNVIIGNTGGALFDLYKNECRPCKQLANMLDKISIELDGKIDIYKINVENITGYEEFFPDISGVPSLFFKSEDDQAVLVCSGFVNLQTLRRNLNEVIKL